MRTKLTFMFTIVLGAILFLVTLVTAQQQTPMPAQPPQPGVPQVQPVPHVPPGQNMPRPPHPPDPLHDVMFPPDMVMGHARQLGLTEDQKAYMRGEIQKTTTSFHELQWKLQDQMELLHETMKAPLVNEEQALAQLNKVLDIEREIKRLHFGLALRIKNRLTPEQHEQLHKMRMGQHMRMPNPLPPGNPLNPIE
jgi:Spy/CpxP family protein refolding chaperone